MNMNVGESRRGRLNKLISLLQKKRGNASEAKFSAALLILVRTGYIKCFLCSNHYNNYRFNPYDRIMKKLDLIGIDFVVFKNDGSVVTVQVKSSKTGIDKFKKFKGNLPKIHVAQVNPWEDVIEDTLKKAVEIIFDNEITFEEVKKKFFKCNL